MTQRSDGLYGLTRPKFYVKWRGYFWLNFGGQCPNCYSSPPHPDCMICDGTYDYGYKLTWANKIAWKYRWKYRTLRKGRM